MQEPPAIHVAERMPHLFPFAGQVVDLVLGPPEPYLVDAALLGLGAMLKAMAVIEGDFVDKKAVTEAEIVGSRPPAKVRVFNPAGQE